MKNHFIDKRLDNILVYVYVHKFVKDPIMILQLCVYKPF